MSDQLSDRQRRVASDLRTWASRPTAPTWKQLIDGAREALNEQEYRAKPLVIVFFSAFQLTIRQVNELIIAWEGFGQGASIALEKMESRWAAFCF